MTWTHLSKRETLHLWDCKTFEELTSRQLDWKVEGSAHSDSTLFVWGGAQTSALRFSGVDLAPRGALEFGFRIYGLAVSADGRALFVVTRPNPLEPYVMLRVDPKDGTVLNRQPLATMNRIRATAVSPDGAHLVVVGGALLGRDMIARTSTPNRVYVLGSQDLKIVWEETLVSMGNVVAFDPTGRTFVTGLMNGQLYLFETASGARQLQFLSEEFGSPGIAGARLSAMQRAIKGGAISPDGRRLYTVSGEPELKQGALAEWDMQTGKRLRLVEGLGCFTGLALSPDGQWLVGSLNSDAAEVWLAR